MRTFAVKCQQMGLKVTDQRMEILRALAATEEHPNAGVVYRQVKKRIPTISLDTVHRNLKLLSENGLISILGMSRENLRYYGNMRPHHHFICVKCGRVCDFVSERIAGVEAPSEAQAFGMPLSVHVEVEGMCLECQRDNKPRCTGPLACPEH